MFGQRGGIYRRDLLQYKSFTITGNTLLDNYYGLQLYNVPGQTISENTCPGYWGSISTPRTIVCSPTTLSWKRRRRNLHKPEQNPTVRNSVFYKNTNWGIYIRNNNSNARFSDNIFWIEGAGNTGLYFQYANPADQGHSADYNLYHILSGATLGYWGSARSTFDDWRDATRQDGHGFSADPLFADALGGDFHIFSQGGRYRKENG